MPSTRHATLETPIEGLWASPPAQLPYIATAQVLPEGVGLVNPRNPVC